MYTESVLHKKTLSVLAFSFLLAAEVSAQDAKNALSVGLALFGLSANYERCLNEKLSIFVEAAYDVTVLPFAADAYAVFGVKTYPFDGAFYLAAGFGPGLGLNMLYGIETVEEAPESDSSSSPSNAASAYGYALALSLGWKIDVGRSKGFFIQPALGFNLILGTDSSDPYTAPQNGHFAAAYLAYARFGMGWLF
jgi:hypothetical protein